MRRTRTLAVFAVAAAAMVAYAVGNGDIRATNEVTVVTITSPTGSGSGTATLQNTTSATTYNVLVAADATCDPGMTFAVSGGNPIASFAPMTSRNVQIGCPARGSDAMRRCVYHATNNLSGTPLADFMGLCIYGASTPTLTPLQTTLDFGTVPVGGFVQQVLTVRNDGTQSITRVYLQTTDLDGTFQLGAPCNPDATHCDEELDVSIAAGGTFTVGVKCRPQAAGAHTAQLLVGTDTFQLLSLGVTLQCTGGAPAGPALGVNPTTIEIPSPVEMIDDTAEVVVHLENMGSGTLTITDVRTVDVDAGAAEDWSYIASGKCSGQITSMCLLGGADRVDIKLTFDPSVIGGRRAALLVSYRDTIDRTIEIPLEATGRGATLRPLATPSTLLFGRVPIGRTSQLDIRLVNDGNRDTTAMLSLGAGSTPPFSLTPAAMATVAPTMPRTIAVLCAPAAEGEHTTTVTADAGDDVTTAPISITATCEGTLQDLYANPTALQLGELRLGPGTVTRSVQLLSAGAPISLVGQPQLESPNPSITFGPLDQNTTPATFDVMISPQSEGSLAATISIGTSDGDTLRIPVAGTVVRTSFVVASTLDLGTFCVDQPTTSSNVGIVSDGTATIELMAPALQLSPSPFELAFTTPSLYPHQLSAAQVAIVSVTPKRQQVATTVNDTLTWQTDITGNPTSPTDLTARFIESGGAVAPPALSFGEVTVHLFTDNGQRVVIQNCNPTPLVLDPPMIRTPFSIDSPNFPSILNPNERVAFSVGFHPTRVGPVSDTLRITSPQLPGAPLAVLLLGVGGSGGGAMPDAGAGSNSYDRTSFYACSCNSSRPPWGGWPLAAAVIAVIARRRRAASSPR